MSVASVRTGVVRLPELPQDSRPVQRARAAQQRAEFLQQFQAVIPGKESGEQKSPVLDSVVADLERVSLAFNKRLQFVVDHRSNEVTIKVIDRETDKVIKVLPPEELQRLYRKLKETIGFLFDERV
ncbi:MAG: flagellar protein FlaG [Treponema sp.]|jgi:flagellar protein FlaG|nr:flagellar protein FlaG [Treponema sp.]